MSERGRERERVRVGEHGRRGSECALGKGGLTSFIGKGERAYDQANATE
jgi:hypothetical protein